MTPNSVMRLAEVVVIENRPIIGDYVLRKEVWNTLGSDGRYKYGEYRSKALFDRMDNRVGRSYSSNYTDSWAIGQKNEKIIENCVAIRFVDERLNDYYGVNER
jgi:hypothetical protein